MNLKNRESEINEYKCMFNRENRKQNGCSYFPEISNSISGMVIDRINHYTVTFPEGGELKKTIY
jgi:hypothetical protein